MNLKNLFFHFHKSKNSSKLRSTFISYPSLDYKVAAVKTLTGNVENIPRVQRMNMKGAFPYFPKLKKNKFKLHPTFKSYSTPVLNEVAAETFRENVANSSPFQRRRITKFLDNEILLQDVLSAVSENNTTNRQCSAQMELYDDFVQPPTTIYHQIEDKGLSERPMEDNNYFSTTTTVDQCNRIHIKNSCREPFLTSLNENNHPLGKYSGSLPVVCEYELLEHIEKETAITVINDVKVNCRSPVSRIKMRERSKIGIRSSLPFPTSGLASSSTSGASSGASDTQSQGSGSNDAKSDSLAQDESRKISKANCGTLTTNNSTLRGPKSRDIGSTSEERETSALRQEVETLRAEITKSRQTILHMQEREKKHKDKLEEIIRNGSDNPQSKFYFGGRFENLSFGECRPSSLVRKYAHLYAQTRLDTLDALDALPDLRHAEELKAKLLFSVVVLAFRSVSSSAQATKEEVRRILQMDPPPSPDAENEGSQSPHSRNLELAIANFIASNIENHDLTKNVEEVCEQIWATLYDYPCLKSCESLIHYTKSCIRMAWGLVNQSPPYVLEYEARTFRSDLHIRFHTSNHHSETIKTYIWPALLEETGGHCAHQAVVVT